MSFLIEAYHPSSKGPLSLHKTFISRLRHCKTQPRRNRKQFPCAQPYSFPAHPQGNGTPICNDIPRSPRCCYQFAVQTYLKAKNQQNQSRLEWNIIQTCFFFFPFLLKLEHLESVPGGGHHPCKRDPRRSCSSLGHRRRCSPNKCSPADLGKKCLQKQKKWSAEESRSLCSKEISPCFLKKAGPRTTWHPESCLLFALRMTYTRSHQNGFGRNRAHIAHKQPYLNGRYNCRWKSQKKSRSSEVFENGFHCLHSKKNYKHLFFAKIERTARKTGVLFEPSSWLKVPLVHGKHSWLPAAVWEVPGGHFSQMAVTPQASWSRRLWLPGKHVRQLMLPRQII